VEKIAFATDEEISLALPACDKKVLEWRGERRPSNCVIAGRSRNDHGQGACGRPNWR